MKKKNITFIIRLIPAIIMVFTLLQIQPPVQDVYAQTNHLDLLVFDAQTSGSIGTYKYLINIDNTGNPDQPRYEGCYPTDPGYPDSCDWPSVREVPSSAPIYTSGDQDDFGAGLDLPAGKYLISILADGYKMGGAHFTVPFTDTDPVTVNLQPNPLPSAWIRIKVFEDISPTNGQFDAPAEHGLAGFRATINDTAGDISTDVFGNPLCTLYDGAGNPLPEDQQIGDACLYSDENGDIAVPNLGPLRYDVVITAPDGETWLETTTLEGGWSWDTWVQEGYNGLDNEFVNIAEPFPWTMFGFVQPCEIGSCPVNVDPGATGGVSGTLVEASVYLPQTGALPYVGSIWDGFTGTKITGPVEEGWIAISDLSQGDTAVYVGPANPDGSFHITGLPDGDYLFTWWDFNLQFILDWIQVTVSNGEVTDLGTPMLTGWFTRVEGFVFEDLNKNGIMDPGEPGVPNYLVVLRDRDNSEIDRMSIATTTEMDGYYVFEKAYPMTSWMVLEAYNDRYYSTGFTYQVDNQPQETTILGGGVDIGFLPVLGQPARLDWGVHPYEEGTNGGIAGSTFYDTTRNELDPRFQAVEPWSPGIPDLTMNLYEPVPCTEASVSCDPNGFYELADDGSIAKGRLLNMTITETWEQPTGCTALDANGDPLPFGDGNQEFLPTDGAGNQDPTQRCLEAPMTGTQIQNGFASLDGNWGFADGCFSGDGAIGEGVCADGSDPIPLPAGDYLVEVEIPQDALGRDMYKVVREEDVNVFEGDEYIPEVPPPACAGALHTVDVAGIGPDGPDAVDNPSFAAEGGSIYEGQERPLCDVKLVELNNGKSVAPLFTLFTEVPLPGRWKGYIIDDLSVSTNPIDQAFGEKAGMPNAPIGLYDFDNQLITTIHSDPNGLYEVLLPSNHTVNCPSPSGVCANVYYMLGNDPGQPGALNPNYNPQYRTIGASFEIYPGLILPSDLAPTQIVPGVLAAGSMYASPPQCAIDTETPQLFAVSQPYIQSQRESFTIFGDGFGATAGEVTLDGVSLTIDSWTNTQIDVTTVPNVSQGPNQLNIINAMGNELINGLTIHKVLGSYTPDIYEVGVGRTFDPQVSDYAIQEAIDTAAQAGGDALVVVYPGFVEQWNPYGAYYENLIIYSPIKLQGVGPGGFNTLDEYTPGTVLDGRGVAGDTPYAEEWRVRIETDPAITWDGLQAIYEGAGMYVLAEDGEFTSAYNAAIDGFTISGSDQQGFLNQGAPVAPDERGIAAVQGGGIFVNGYARFLQITNNILQSNGGAYGGAIRLGTPHLIDFDIQNGTNLSDSQNDDIRIAHNRILANGGTNLAGAIGVFSGTENYEIAHNDICGNYSAEYGGGISHYGFSPGGEIHDNRVYFNRSYDEGGGIIIAGELPPEPTMLTPGAGEVSVYSNLIQANLANDDGGGLRYLMAGDFPYEVFNNIIVNNISTHEGAGISLNDAPDVTVFNNTIMKNITTASAMTSNGLPAPTGLSTSRNSSLLQSTLDPDAPIFSNPVLFNNIFWDNRAGTFTGATVAGIGLEGDPTGIVHWDVGIQDTSVGLLEPTYSILQTEHGTVPDGTNLVGVDPQVVSIYDTSVMVAPWRGNPRFVDILIVTVLADANVLGDYHLRVSSPAIDAGTPMGAPSFDYDGDLRPQNGHFEIGADEIRIYRFFGPMIIVY